MCGGAQAADGLYTTRYGRTARAGGVRCGAVVLRGGARGALRRGGAGVAIGQRELERALLEDVRMLCVEGVYYGGQAICIPGVGGFNKKRHDGRRDS